MVPKLHFNHRVLLEWLEMREAKEHLDLGWMNSSLGVSCFIKSLLTCSYSFQGKTVKNAGWDFSIGASQGIGTVRALKPPHARERRQEVPSTQTSQRATRASGSQLSPTSGITVNDYEDGFHDEVRSFASCVPDAVRLLLHHFFAVTTAPGKLFSKAFMLCVFHVI